MIYSINPSKDASIYRESSSMNAGLDEVLEIGKDLITEDSYHLIRSLIQFDLSTISYGTSASGSRKFYLKMYATDPDNIQLTYDIEAAPISQEWAMGSGKRYDDPITTDGVNWNYRSGDSIDDWWASGSSTAYGGTWLSGSGQVVTQSFSYENADANIDVTSIVEQWIASSISNYGFILKFTDTEESNSTEYGILKFFSKDSNTVYKPKLILKWDDSVTGSGVPVAGTLSADDSVVYIKANRPLYSYLSTEKIRVMARDRYPAKTFNVTQSQYVSFTYLPTSSYYGVKDAYTGEMVVDYDTSYTKLSSDSNGNFFNFNFGTLFTGRLYKFVFKVVNGTLTQFYDPDLYFKVIR